MGPTTKQLQEKRQSGESCVVPADPTSSNTCSTTTADQSAGPEGPRDRKNELIEQPVIWCLSAPPSQRATPGPIRSPRTKPAAAVTAHVNAEPTSVLQKEPSSPTSSRPGQGLARRGVSTSVERSIWSASNLIWRAYRVPKARLSRELDRGADWVGTAGIPNQLSLFLGAKDLKNQA